MEVTTLWIDWDGKSKEVDKAETIELPAGTTAEVIADITSGFDDDCEEIKVLFDVDGGYPEEVLASTTGDLPNITTPSTYTIGNFEVLEGEHTYRVLVQCPAGDVNVVESFALTIKQATCVYEMYCDVVSDFCSWLNNNPSPTTQRINDKISSYEAHIEDEACSSEVSSILTWFNQSLDLLKQGDTTVSELKSSNCSCRFNSVEGLTNDFCSWLNEQEGKTIAAIKMAVVPKIKEYQIQYCNCSGAIYDKIVDYITEVVSLYMETVTVSDLISQYCPQTASITFESSPSAKVYVDGNYKGTT